MVHDKSGKILSFNARLEKISGYSKREIPDIRTWIEKVYPDRDYRTIILAERQTASSEPESKTRTKPAIITRKDGVKQPCRFSSAWTSAGIRIVFIEEADDLQSEAVLLQESEKRFHLLSEAAFEAVILHKQGVLLKANAQFYKMFGYDSQELLGTRIVPQVFAEKNGDSAKPKTEKKTAPPYETVGYKKDGTQFPILVNTRPSRYHGREAKMSTIQDLSDNRQTQLALRNSEARLKSVIESLPYEFFMLDADERYLMVNSVAQHRWGNPIGKRPEDLAADKKTLTLWKNNNRRALAGETVAEEVELRRQGKSRFLYNIISPIHSAGQIIGIVGVNFDITTLKTAESALRESEERFRQMAEHLSEVFWLFDWINKKVIYVSPSYKKVWGRSADDLYRNYDEWKQSIYPDDLAHAQASFDAIIATGGGDTRQYRIVRPDGEIRWISDRGFAIADDKGRLYRIAGIAKDITERKAAENALRESEEKFRNVAEQSPNIIFINKGGKVVYANQKSEEITGYPREEICSENFDFLTLIAPESVRLIKKNLAKHFQGIDILPQEYTILTRKGKRIDTIITTKLINYGGEKAILGIVTDISEHKLTEKKMAEKDRKLKRQKKDLEEMNTALRVLLEQREKEKADFKENIFVNLNKLVIPYIDKLKISKLGGESQIYLDIIKSNLNDLIGPIANTLSSKYFGFTPSEIQVANLIGQGKATKEIAMMLNVSPKAVSFHRANIRKKLGLSNKKVNLRTYLQSLPVPSQ